jgi:outer membrane protein OmpA-like peptidoglycan-associated protein
MKPWTAVRPLALSLAALIGAGCATAPQTHNALESARSTYRLAHADPEVQLRAPVELQLAERSLVQAERFWRDGADAGIVAHHAYLAEQRSRIAMKTADYRKAEAAVATSGEQRNRVLLEARSRELEAERQKAEAQRQAAEELRREAERTQQQALDDKRVADERATQLAAEMQRLQSEVSDLKTQQTERGWVLTLRNELLFDSGRASLKPGAEKALENLAQLMKREPGGEITIEGFTDSTGSEDTNRRLSEQRAQAVKQALVARGIEAYRIDARGYGPAFPVASNDTPTGRQLNRRVEVVIAPPARASSGGATRQ